MRTEEDLKKDVCNHCGVSIHYQAPRESGCNHVYYPEACPVCSVASAYLETVKKYDLSKITRRLP